MSIIFGEAETAAFHFACTIPHKSFAKNWFKNPQTQVKILKFSYGKEKEGTREGIQRECWEKRRNTKRRKEQEEEHREMEGTR